MRTRFKDEALDKQYENEGYAIIRNYANADQMSKMQQVLDDAYKDRESFYNWKPTVTWNTLVMATMEVRRDVSEKLMHILSPTIGDHFYDYLPFFSFTLIKPPGEVPNPINLHRDSSTVSEDSGDAITMWLPLVDINKKNGCMYFIPGSQRLFKDELPFGVEWPYLKYRESLKKYLVDVPLKAGDLLLFSPRILHGSYSNQTNIPRHVVSSVLIHPDSEVLYNYYDKGTNTVKAYEVDPWFFFRGEFEEPVGKYPLARTYTYSPPNISEKEIRDFFEKDSLKTNIFSNLLSRLGLKSLSV